MVSLKGKTRMYMWIVYGFTARRIVTVAKTLNICKSSTGCSSISPRPVMELVSSHSAP